MIISFNGDLGSGKSTIADMMSKELGYSRYTMGEIFRNLAREKNMTLEEFHALCDKSPAVDKEVDNYVVELSKKEDDFVIDSRTAWYFIPQSVKLYLKVDEKEAARRIFLERRNDDRKNEGRHIESKEDVLASLKKRKTRDDERYRRYYGIDGRDENRYDLVVDTTHLSIEDVFKKVMGYVKSRS